MKVAINFHMKMPVNIQFDYFADYIGFLVPDVFVIGFGSDYNEELRELPHLCSISPYAIEHHSPAKKAQRK